MLLMDALD